MSNVVNVVGRKRVEARKNLINRALSTDVKTSSLYVYKHSIVVDSSVAFPQPHTEADDGTTYDKNDITSSELVPAIRQMFSEHPNMADFPPDYIAINLTIFGEYRNEPRVAEVEAALEALGIERGAA